MSALPLSPRSGIQVSSVYPTYTHIKGQSPVCVFVCACVCVCVAKPVAVELRCHATALISPKLCLIYEKLLGSFLSTDVPCLGCVADKGSFEFSEAESIGRRLAKEGSATKTELAKLVQQALPLSRLPLLPEGFLPLSRSEWKVEKWNKIH